MRIGGDDEAARANTCNDSALTFVVVNVLVTHAASDELDLAAHDGSLAYDYP